MDFSPLNNDLALSLSFFQYFFRKKQGISCYKNMEWQNVTTFIGDISVYEYVHQP